MVLFNCQYKTLKPTGGLWESIRPNLEPTSCKETSLRPLLANGVSLGTRQPCEDISSESCLGLKESPIFQVGECQSLVSIPYFLLPNRVKILLKYENYVGYLDLNKHGSNTIISEIAGSLSSF